MAESIFIRINNKCVYVLFIFCLTYLCLTNGASSQSIRNSAEVNQNTKEPPDLQNQVSNANSRPNLSDNKIRDGKTLSNTNQMRFLCRNRLPVFASRRNLPAQTTESPYKIVIPPEVRPGQVIEVTIQSMKGKPFRSYMLQILSSDVVIGEFQASPEVNLQNCYSNADTATFAGSGKRKYATVQWKTPEDLQTNIVVRATIVQNYKTYWADVMSLETPVISAKDDKAIQLTNEARTNDLTGNGDNNNADADRADKDNMDDLKKAVSDTFESIDGPLESLDEVLTHQGIREVTHVGSKANGDDKNVIHVPSISVDDELTAPRPTTQYVYREMNMNPLDFEPPQTSEFLGTLLKLGSKMMGSGNNGPVPGAVAGGSGMGGLGSMMTMMKMFGGGGGGGGGGLMSSLGTMSKLSGMMGGGGGGGMPGGLGALSSISGLLGGGGGAASPPAAGGGGGGLGGLGALSSLGGLLGGLGRKKESAPPPVGQPVKPRTANGEPSLADLLGVDPNTAVVMPTVIPSEVNPMAGVAAAKSGGLLSSIGGFAPMLAGIPIAMKMFGGKKKTQQQPPWGQQGMQGQIGQFGQMGMQGQNGQFGQMGMQNGQFGGAPNGQFGQMGAPNGQMGQNGQFGQMPGGQFGQMPGGQFGQMPGANGLLGQNPAGGFGQSASSFGQSAGGFGQAAGGFGQTAAGLGTFGQTQSSADTDRIIKLLEQQRSEIEALKNQLSGNSIVSRMGSFGNIPLSLGQPSTQMFGLKDTGSGLSGSSLSSLSPAPSSSGNDALLQQLMQQNQMLMQQNQQFNSMATSSMGNGQFGTTSNPFSRVNRSNGQMVDSLNPSNTLGTNGGTGNFPQNQNSFLGQNQFNNAGGTMGQFQNAGQNAMGMNTNANSMMNNNIMSNGGGAMVGQSNNMMNNNMMSNGGGTMAGQSNNMMNAMGANMFGGQQGGVNAASGSQGMGASSMVGSPPQNQAQNGGGGSLANMFGGTGGGSGGMSGLFGGGSSGGGGGPLAGLLGGGGGGAGSPLAGLLGGGGGGGPDLSGLMQNVDMNAMQSVIGGKEGQDLMNNMMGMLQGPEGGNLMKAVEGVMSGKSDPGEIQKLMSGMDMGALQQMASQAEGMLSKTGIDPSAIMGLMG